MLGWWNALSDIQRVFAFIAVPSSLVLAVQTVLLLFGIGGADSDVDVDVDTDDFFEGDIGNDGLTLFSIRGIMAMFCVAGWSGIVFIDFGLGSLVSSVLAIACGIAALFGIAYLMKAVFKLQSNGNIDLGTTIGKTGQVYIPIPPRGEGQGKITITAQDRFIEVDAVSNADEVLKTGELVRVISTNELGLVMVERAVK